jgi:hypothetical protein
MAIKGLDQETIHSLKITLLPVLEIPYGIRGLSLPVDDAVRAIFQSGLPARDSSEECCPIDKLSTPVCFGRRRLAFALDSDNLRLALLWGHDNLLSG